MPLTIEQKAAIFERIWEEYVEAHGLGSMSKADFDALVLWEYVNVTDSVDYFALSTTFKIRESRARSLLETAAVKFMTLEDHEVWSRILDALQKVDYNVESIERGQMRFHFKEPLLFRYLQNQARTLHDSFTFNPASEYIVGSLKTLYRILELAWKEKAFGEKWADRELRKQQAKIKVIVGKIGENIKSNHLEELKSRKTSKIPGIVHYGSGLSGIGSVVIALDQAIRS